MSTELRDGLASIHEAVFADLLEAVEGLDDTGWRTPTGCPGWDVHDQLAHVVSLEALLLGEPFPDVELPSDLDHVVNDFGRAVEPGVHARRGSPHDELVTEARATFTRRVEALRTLDPAALGERMDGPGGMQMKGSQLLRTRLFDTTTHEYDIRRAVGRDRAVRPQDRIACEQVLRAWARMLPRAGLDAGSLIVEVPDVLTATVELTTGAFTLGEEAAPAPDHGSVRFRLTPAWLLALGGGRSDAPDIGDLDAVGAVEGDAELAARVVASATVTP
jgi:uncharacterized protein (TIGR03083 family)